LRNKISGIKISCGNKSPNHLPEDTMYGNLKKDKLINILVNEWNQGNTYSRDS
jgi:hypothetical protein